MVGNEENKRHNIFVTFLHAADLGHCPKGWEEFPGSNKCYKITDVHDMRTRDDASAQCQLQQAQLVKIDSIQERVGYCEHFKKSEHQKYLPVS